MNARATMTLLAAVSVSCSTKAERVAAGIAIADAIQASRPISSIAPQHLEWLVGGGGWTAHDIDMLEGTVELAAMQWRTVQLDQELGRVRGKPPSREEAAQTAEVWAKWRAESGQVSSIASAFRDGDPAEALRRLRKK